MDNEVVVAPIVVAVLGALAPLLISLLKAANAPAIVNQAVALVVSFGAAIVSVFVVEGFSFDDVTIPLLLGYAGMVFVVAQSIYRLYFGSTALNARLERLLWGAKTST